MGRKRSRMPRYHCRWSGDEVHGELKRRKYPTRPEKVVTHHMRMGSIFELLGDEFLNFSHRPVSICGLSSRAFPTNISMVWLPFTFVVSWLKAQPRTSQSLPSSIVMSERHLCPQTGISHILLRYDIMCP